MQAKDISDAEMLGAVVLDIIARNSMLGAAWSTICERSFPDVPEKVVRAKLRSLTKRGLLRGCTCGCRGDFGPIGVELTAPDSAVALTNEIRASLHRLTSIGLR